MKKSLTFLFIMILAGCGIYDKDIYGNYTILPVEEEPKAETSWNYHNELIIDNFLIHKEEPKGFKSVYVLGNKIYLADNADLYLKINNNYSYHKKQKGYWPLLPLFPYYFTKDEYNECGKKVPVPIEITINKDSNDNQIIITDFYINLENGKRINPILTNNKIRTVSFPIDIAEAMNQKQYPKPNTFVFPLYCNELNGAEIIIEATVNGKEHTSKSKIHYKEDTLTGRYIVFFYAISCAISGEC